MKKKYLLFLYLFTYTLTFSQNDIDDFIQPQNDEVNELTIIVEPYMQLSNGAFFTSLTLVSDNPYVEYINGFEFEWGYRYQLRVKETIYANPPQDASDRAFELVEVVLQTLSSKPFKMILLNEFYLSKPKGESVIKIKTGLYRYHDEMEFKVPPMLRAEFDRKMKNKTFCKGYFDFDDDGKIKLLKLE
jgi:hypothetical protein